MTEQEWWACNDPLKLLKKARFRLFKRKSRLFACACCRCTWDLLVDDRSKKAVETAERHADSLATDDELGKAANAAMQVHDKLFRLVGKKGSSIDWAAAIAAGANPFSSAKNASWMAPTPRCFEVRQRGKNDFDDILLFPCAIQPRAAPMRFLLGNWRVTKLDQVQATGAEKSVQATLIRDIYGNPFYPIPLIDASWLTPAVTEIAIVAYAERVQPSGRLNGARLAALADALQEAGCDNEEILAHLRGPGPHVRGCWALDLILGKD
jgi:hypothetical protein